MSGAASGADIYNGENTAARWEHWHKSPPTNFTVGKLIYLARQANPDFRLPSLDKPKDDHVAMGAKPSVAPQQGDARYDLSHDGLALDLGRKWQNEARHVALWDRWMLWTGSRWRRDEQLAHMTRTRDYLRSRADLLVRAAAQGEIEGLDVEAAEVLAKSLRSAPMVANVIGLARSNAELVASTEQWDADRWGLGTPVGMVDLRAGEIEERTPWGLHYQADCGCARSGGDGGADLASIPRAHFPPRFRTGSVRAARYRVQPAR